MAAVSGRMPAIGVVETNVLSGSPAIIHSLGFHQMTSGMNDYSGYMGKTLYVGRSGQIHQVSGSWGSGGWLSGDMGQILGLVINSGAVLYNIGLRMTSGGPYGLQGVA